MKQFMCKLLLTMTLAMGCIFVAVPTTTAYADETDESVQQTTKSDDWQIGFEDGEFVNSFDDDSNGTDSINSILEKGKYIITVIGACVTLVLMGLFFIQIGKLGAAADNPTMRKSALAGLLWSGIAAGLLGAATIIFALAYNVFK